MILVLILFKNEMIISLRLAEKKDLMEVFNLSNEDLVRKSSFKPGKIELVDHKKWFLQKLQDKNALILIAENNKHFIGVVRFDMKKENVIGISISPDFRGQGLGSRLIAKGLKYLEKTKPEIKKITAYIKVDNIASIKTFEKSGFRLDQSLSVDGYKALKYIYSLGETNAFR